MIVPSYPAYRRGSVYQTLLLQWKERNRQDAKDAKKHPQIARITQRGLPATN
jgi:hypothetical protein